jgi:hypothetical protein
MTPITAWHKATRHIERDVRLSELTDDEIASIVTVIREREPMTKDDAIKAIEEWQDISTAPRDGRVIIVRHEDVGSFPMAWNNTGNNEIFAPDAVGIWEAPDRSMTWSEADDCGPSHWMLMQADKTEKA